MNKFQFTLLLFITSIIAGIFCLVSYLGSIVNLIKHIKELNDDPDLVPEYILSFLTPTLVISAIIAGLCSLVFRIMAIVHVANSKSLDSGMKVIWILGLILMAFITGILYLIFSYQNRFDKTVSPIGTPS